jgi:hypothetical protein
MTAGGMLSLYTRLCVWRQELHVHVQYLRLYGTYVCCEMRCNLTFAAKCVATLPVSAVVAAANNLPHDVMLITCKALEVAETLFPTLSTLDALPCCRCTIILFVQHVLQGPYLPGYTATPDEPKHMSKWHETQCTPAFSNQRCARWLLHSSKLAVLCCNKRGRCINSLVAPAAGPLPAWLHSHARRTQEHAQVACKEQRSLNQRCTKCVFLEIRCSAVANHSCCTCCRAPTCLATQPRQMSPRKCPGDMKETAVSNHSSITLVTPAAGPLSAWLHSHGR